MIRFNLCSIAVALALVMSPEVIAGGFGGRGGGHSFGGGGRSVGGGGGGARFNARPNVGSARPNISGGSRMPMQRPQTSMPHLGGNHSFNPGPSARPGMTKPNVNRPSLGGSNVQRPNIERPNVQRPTAQLPNAQLPNAQRPNIERPNIERPSVTRPALRPDVRTPNLPDRGNVGRPDRGNLGNAVANRPSMPNFDKLPSGRPSRGQLGDFLGIDNLTPGDRRPPAGLGNVNVGDINLGNNNVISRKPTWANIDDNRVNAINRRWQNGIANATTLPALSPNRLDHFHEWGNGIRDHWNDNPFDCFRPDWWDNHRFHCSGWHYIYSYSNYPYTYWWNTPNYDDFGRWFAWNVAAAASQQPVYYDYGDGGNVTYQDNSVYIGGQEIAGSDEFAESAATLATVPQPASKAEADEAEWMPLGTFALTTDPDDTAADRIVQLAVDKQGIVSGTLYNKSTDKTQALQGRVDKETQRVAVRIGESEKVIAETGLYNLTQDEVSLLVHYGTQTQDDYLLVRLPSPDSSADATP